jgi:hypothetical protein
MDYNVAMKSKYTAIIKGVPGVNYQGRRPPFLAV